MANEVIFATQMASLLAYVASVFVLYRMLVSQKDATIEAVRSRCELLEEQLVQARKSTPDLLTKQMDERIVILTNELERLSADKHTSTALIQKKQDQLAELEAETRKLEEQINRARDLVQDFTCPKCGALMRSRQYNEESVEYRGRDVDVDHEIVLYECGREVIDGKVTRECK